MKKDIILVVDDEKKIAEVVKSYLENSGYEVFTAYTGKEALNIFERTNLSLIVLDLMLPDIAGEEICKTIRKKSRVPIIMLTAKSAEDDQLQGLNIGADDYVLKPFSTKTLVARVNAVIRRTKDETGLLTNIFSFNNDELVVDVIGHDVKCNGEEVSLTPNEFNILTHLMKYPKKVFTRDDLINIALDENFEGFSRVIDTHIKNLRQKIEKDPKDPKYILTVYGVGYRFGGV